MGDALEKQHSFELGKPPLFETDVARVDRVEVNETNISYTEPPDLSGPINNIFQKPEQEDIKSVVKREKSQVNPNNPIDLYTLGHAVKSYDETAKAYNRIRKLQNRFSSLRSYSEKRIFSYVNSNQRLSKSDKNYFSTVDRLKISFLYNTLSFYEHSAKPLVDGFIFLTKAFYNLPSNAVQYVKNGFNTEPKPLPPLPLAEGALSTPISRSAVVEEDSYGSIPRHETEVRTDIDATGIPLVKRDRSKEVTPTRPVQAAMINLKDSDSATTQPWNYDPHADTKP